jgi:hypothetical protein
VDAARRRSAARAARDWQTADRLRAEIEAAGWRVIDAGLDYRLEPASPPSVEVAGEIRYGRSDAVPSRLDAPPEGLATVIFLASADAPMSQRSLRALETTLPSDTAVVVVADGVAPPDGAHSHEVVRTSAALGRGAALNIGIRRAAASVVVVLDPSIVPAGDVVTPLVESLRDPTVAIAGPVGLVSADLQRFDEVLPKAGPLDVTAIHGQLLAFRRADAVERGPVDEGFRSAERLDVWWSLVLRDEGEHETPRRAVAIPGLELERGEPAARDSTPPARGSSPPADRDRLSRRNFYRVLDRFRGRLDLAVSKNP